MSSAIAGPLGADRAVTEILDTLPAGFIACLEAKPDERLEDPATWGQVAKHPVIVMTIQQYGRTPRVTRALGSEGAASPPCRPRRRTADDAAVA